MSIKKIEEDLGKVLRNIKSGFHQKAYEDMNKIVLAGTWHVVKINVKKFITGMTTANRRALVKSSGWSKVEVDAILNDAKYLDSWEQCIKDEVAKFTTAARVGALKNPHNMSSEYGDDIYYDTKSTKLVYKFYIPPGGVTKPSNFLTKFRNSVQKCWSLASQKDLKSTFGNKVESEYVSKITHADVQKETGKPYIPGGISGAHDKSVLLAYFEQAIRGVSAGITANVSSFNLFEEILKEAKFTWVEDSNLTKSPFTSTRSVGITAKDNPNTKYDGRKAVTALLNAIETVRDSGSFKALGKAGADAEASVPFAQQAAAAAQYAIVRELMKKNAKRSITAKIKTKKPKNKKGRPVRLRTNITTAVKTQQISLPQKIAISKGKEKGQGKEASTSIAMDLARLKQAINSKLPAEVRRNMGRPALRNQTGRFSNSVQILSLHQAKETIMAKYTYLLSPYQTFENTGSKRWPLAYNPKTLIAKSIRNLAMGRIEQKLTVRRV